jgi:hypothetical protein
MVIGSVYLNQHGVLFLMLMLIAARCYAPAPLNDSAATDELENDHDYRDHEQGMDQAPCSE